MRAFSAVGVILLVTVAHFPGIDGLRISNLHEAMSTNMTGRFCFFVSLDGSVQDCDGGAFVCKDSIAKNVCTRIVEFQSPGGSLKIECLEDGKANLELWESDNCTGPSQASTEDPNQCKLLAAGPPSALISVSCTAMGEEESTTTPTPTPTAAPAVAPSCFSESSTLILSNGEMKSLANIRVGDKVQSFDRSGRLVFSEVFLVQHQNAHETVEMLDIAFYEKGNMSEQRSISVSPNHYLAASCRGEKRRADAFKAGSSIFVLNSEGVCDEATVTSVTNCLSVPRNVHTLNDRLVVDGVFATPFVEMSVARVPERIFGPVLLLPLKIFHKLGLHPVVVTLDNIAHRAASLVK